MSSLPSDRMTQKWVGYLVSIECVGDLGRLEGKVSYIDADRQNLVLKNVTKNGITCVASSVTISAKDIKHLEIIDEPSKTYSTESEEQPSRNVVVIKKPVAKRLVHSVNESGSSSVIATMTPASQLPPPQSYLNQQESHNYDIGDGNRSPSKRERLRQRWQERDEACFGTPIDNDFDEDFDFEKNLALFNKKAVYDEILSQRPDLARHADGNRRLQNYRHDENVIRSGPTLYRVVEVPSPGEAEYVTDDGLVIPSVQPELRQQLQQKAEELGLSSERQAELMGRAATEMALQLLGGGHRLNPSNAHQWPTVVAMCGSHWQGAVGVNCARQLASHGVKTFVYLMEPAQVTSILAQEMRLYKLTDNKIITNVQELQTLAVDLIVMALAGSWPNYVNRFAASWANENRAPVLALDPPAAGTPGVQTKFSLLPFLPLSHSSLNGKLYLANVGLPDQVFRQVGIKYRSPFGPKFVIPLHPSDS